MAMSSKTKKGYAVYSMAKTIKCDFCGKEIAIGEKVIKHAMMEMNFCSYECIGKFSNIGTEITLSPVEIKRIENYNKNIERLKMRFNV